MDNLFLAYNKLICAIEDNFFSCDYQSIYDCLFIRITMGKDWLKYKISIFITVYENDSYLKLVVSFLRILYVHIF
ncbi:hypothetical protein VNO77_11639 [Canavalia gladiata]|uniref:Uncharacterized protein n=1 Tax=Canavalia gladiata TaxID=3824 RepID=A0AAN9MC52_CANGL